MLWGIPTKTTKTTKNFIETEFFQERLVYPKDLCGLCRPGGSPVNYPSFVGKEFDQEKALNPLLPIISCYNRNLRLIDHPDTDSILYFTLSVFVPEDHFYDVKLIPFHRRAGVHLALKVLNTVFLEFGVPGKKVWFR